MNVEFENLNKIDDILKVLNKVLLNQQSTIFQKWLSVDEVSEYLGYKKETINKMIIDGDFKLNKHYYMKGLKKFFDKNALDKWVMGDENYLNNPKSSIELNTNKEDKILKKEIKSKKFISVKEFTKIYGYSSDWQKNRRGRIHDFLPYIQTSTKGKITYDVTEVDIWFLNNNIGRCS